VADDYVFNDHTDAEKVREALEQGTDPNGRPILRNVTQSKVADGDNAALGSTADSAAQSSSESGSAISFLKWLGFLLNNGATVQGGTSEGNAPQNAPVLLAGKDQNGDVDVPELVNGQIVTNALVATQDSVESVKGVPTRMHQGSEVQVQTAQTSVTSTGTTSGVLPQSSGDNYIILDWEVTAATGGSKVDVVAQDGTGTVIDGIVASDGSGAVKNPSSHIGETGEGNALDLVVQSLPNGSVTVELVRVRLSYITV
jgi:hypothetical protein